MKKTITAFLIVLSLFVLLVSCENFSDGDVPQSITLSETLIEYDNMTQVQGKIMVLSADVTLKNGKKSTDIRWEYPSDGIEVLSKADGKLTYSILKSGRYTIKAYSQYGGRDYINTQCIINFLDSITSIKLKNVETTTIWDKGFSLTKGSSVLLEPVFVPDSTSQKGFEISSDNNIVSISEPDISSRIRLTALEAGTATVTIRSTDNPSVYSSLTVTVKDSGSGQTTNPVEVRLTPASPLSLPINQSTNVTATLRDGFGNASTTGRIIFLSSDPSIVNVTTNNSRSATLTALKAGSAIVTATYSEDSAITSQLYVTVVGAVTDIATDSLYYALQQEDEITIDVSYEPADTVQTGITAVSSDSSVLAVTGYDSTKVTVKALSVGSATLTITSSHNGNVTRQILFSVSEKTSEGEKIRNISLSDSTLTFALPFEEKTLTAYSHIRRDNGTIESSSTEYGFTYELTDPTVVSVYMEDGVLTITPLLPGKTVLTVRSEVDSSLVASCLITVTGSVERLLLSSNNLNITSGSYDTVTATPYPANTQVNSLKVTSSDPAVATADVFANADGSFRITIEGKAIGSAVLTLLADGQEMGSIDVNVSAASALSVYSVSLDRAAITMDQDGEDEVVVVTFYGFDGSEVTSRADFTMSESSSSVIGLTRVGTSNRFIISAKNSGVAIVEFTTEDNPYIATRLRVEVGGSAVQGNTLRALHAPASSIGMKVGSSRTVTVNAIPYDAPVSLLWKTSDSSIANVTGVANSTSAIEIGRAHV